MTEHAPPGTSRKRRRPRRGFWKRVRRGWRRERFSARDVLAILIAGEVFRALHWPSSHVTWSSLLVTVSLVIAIVWVLARGE